MVQLASLVVGIVGEPGSLEDTVVDVVESAPAAVLDMVRSAGVGGKQAVAMEMIPVV